MLKSSLCDYSDVYVLVKETITKTGDGVDDAVKWTDEKIKMQYLRIVYHLENVELKQTRLRQITQIDIDVMMPRYNLLENNGNYSEAFESLYQ